jgi:hypothetical protein
VNTKNTTITKTTKIAKEDDGEFLLRELRVFVFPEMSIVSDVPLKAVCR